MILSHDIGSEPRENTITWHENFEDFDENIKPGRQLRRAPKGIALHMSIFADQEEKDLYIQEVWEKLESGYLQFYPFLTDEEFGDLFGGRILKAMALLNCPQEHCGLCDTDIDCPFYSRKLDRCGIDRYKPVHCRLWHCYDCGPEHLVTEVRELTAIFSDHIGLERGARKIKNALERGGLSAQEARKRFLGLVEEFRNGESWNTG